MYVCMYIYECFTSMFSLVKISLTPFLRFSFVFRPVFFPKQSYLCNKKKITRWLEHMKFVFSWKKRFHSFAAFTREKFFPLEDKLRIFAPPCNILSIYCYIASVFSTRMRALIG